MRWLNRLHRPFGLAKRASRAQVLPPAFPCNNQSIREHAKHDHMSEGSLNAFLEAVLEAFLAGCEDGKCYATRAPLSSQTLFHVRTSRAAGTTPTVAHQLLRLKRLFRGPSRWFGSAPRERRASPLRGSRSASRGPCAAPRRCGDVCRPPVARTGEEPTYIHTYIHTYAVLYILCYIVLLYHI